MNQVQSTADNTAPAKPADERDLIAKQARSEYEAGLKYRHDREQQWQLIEDFYFNRVKKSLKSRFNVPVPILPGFVDTWQAKMAKHATLKFEHDSNEAEYLATVKTTAFYVKVKNKDDYDWDMADTDTKKMAALSGRAILEKYADSVNGFKDYVEPVDHYDFIASPMGGGHLENHQFCGQDNVFRSRNELKQGAEAGIYDPKQVEKLINATQTERIVNNDNVYRSKQNRFIALGLNGLVYNYAGQDLYKFIKMGTTYKGKRYYIVFNYETGVWIRCQPLKEVFKSNLWPWVSWATHRDTFNFWSKGPCDDMVPMTEMIRVLVNQELDNRNKKNYGQRAYDPDIFVNPAELEWKADGLVMAKAGLGAKKIADGVYEFQTPELQGTINLVQWIDTMLKEKTGVNSETQGSADTSKVGIAYLNVQQSSERTALVYESYVKCWQAIGRRFLWGLFEHMRSPMAVKIIGESGAQWDELARREINTDWDIRVEGGQEADQQDAMKKKMLTDMFATLQPDELSVSSPKWRLKTKLQIAGVDDDDIRMAFDLEGDQNKEVLARASMMIQDCLDGKPYKPYRGATTAFVQKILDFATEEDLPMAEYTKLMNIAQQHIKIAQENAVRKAVQIQAGRGVPPTQMPGQAPAGPAATPLPTPAGQVQQQSQGYASAAPQTPQLTQ
jgi:hypothetical protein